MSIKAFVELEIFSLRQKPGITDFESAHDLLAGDNDTKTIILNFVAGIVARCNNKTEDLEWEFEADVLITSRGNISVDLDDVVMAFITSQFGPRIYADIGPSSASAAEARFYLASTHFAQTVKDALSETGHAETAEYVAISQPMANRLRYMLIEIGRARQQFLLSIKPYRYEILARRLDGLYNALEKDGNLPEVEVVIRERIEHIRNFCFSREEDARYEQSRAQKQE